MAGPFRRLMAAPDEWRLVVLTGHTAVFAWHDPERPDAPDPFAGLGVDLGRLALRPPAGQAAPEGHEPGPQRLAWHDAFWKWRPAWNADRDEAALLLALFDALVQQQAGRPLAGWENGAAAAVWGSQAGPPSLATPAGLSLRLALAGAGLRPPRPGEKEPPRPAPLDGMAMYLRQRHLLDQDDAPPELLLLAARAARRAVRSNPDDAGAYVALGEVYLRLARHTRERAWGPRPRLVHALRQAQAVTAFNRAVVIRPDLERPHGRLVELYQEMGYRDLTLKHLKRVLELAQAAGRREGETARQHADRLKRLREDVEGLEKEVKRLQDIYDANSGNLKVFDRAQSAMGRGLAGKALEVLLASDLAAFGKDGMRLELELLLNTGRAEDVRAWMEEEHKGTLGAAEYYRLQAEMEAASGDYARADADLEEMARALVPRPGPAALRRGIAQSVGQAILDGGRQDATPVRLLLGPINRLEGMRPMLGLATPLREEADLTALRGLLALEAGHTDRAERLFRQALSVCPDDEAAASGAGLDFGGRRVAGYWLKRLGEQKRPAR